MGRTATVVMVLGLCVSEMAGAPGRGSMFKATEPYRVDTKGVLPPALVRLVPARYSEEARRAGFEGDLMIAVVVSRQGRVSDARVLRPLGLGLDEEALIAIRKCRFRPAQDNGRNVAAWKHVEFSFRIGAGSGIPKR